MLPVPEMLILVSNVLETESTHHNVPVHTDTMMMVPETPTVHHVTLDVKDVKDKITTVPFAPLTEPQSQTVHVKTE